MTEREPELKQVPFSFLLRHSKKQGARGSREPGLSGKSMGKARGQALSAKVKKGSGAIDLE